MTEQAKDPTVSNPVEAVVSCDCKCKKQCWEPCGDLGKNEKHVKQVDCLNHTINVKNMIIGKSN